MTLLVLLDAGAEDTRPPLGMGGAIRTARANGPLRILQDEVVPTELTVAVVTRTAMATPISSLADSKARRFLDELNDCGSGSLTLKNSDGDLTHIVHDRLIIFYILGVAAWTMLIESTNRATISPQEEAGELTVIEGRGHLAITEEAVVYPARGVDQLPIEEDRLFSWPSIDYIDDGWGFATELCTVADAQANWPLLPMGQGFLPTTAKMIWASSGTTADAPPGRCYFRFEFTTAFTGWHMILSLADNAGEVYLDGAKVATIPPDVAFLRATETPIFLSAGTHLLAMWVENGPDDADPGGNPGAAAWAIWESNQAGDLNVLVAVSNGTARIVEYADPPGMTPGQAIRILVEEAQARGALAGIILGFGDYTDSNGQPWIVYPDIATKVGTDYLTFLRELASTYIDVWMEPTSLTLHAWNHGTRGTTRNVPLEVADSNDALTGNLLALGHLRVT